MLPGPWQDSAKRRTFVVEAILRSSVLNHLPDMALTWRASLLEKTRGNILQEPVPQKEIIIPKFCHCLQLVAGRTPVIKTGSTSFQRERSSATDESGAIPQIIQLMCQAASGPEAAVLVQESAHESIMKPERTFFSPRDQISAMVSQGGRTMHPGLPNTVDPLHSRL
ncbi:hypothetical protein PCE1_003654 [Barthelona sp. PCE]